MAETEERVILIEDASLSHLEADSTKGIELDTALEYDEGIASQLGSSIHKNRPEDLLSPRVIITEYELRNFHFQARYHAPARFGIYKGQPACLVVIDFSFKKSGSTVSRYTHADISVSFEDGSTALLKNPGNVEELDVDPKILRFEPVEYRGSKTSGEGSKTYGMSVNAAPGGAGGVTIGYSETIPTVKERYEKVNGDLRDFGTGVNFSIEENTMTGSGIRSDWSAAMIIGYVPGRRFAARVTIKAYILYRMLPNPVCGKGDDPVFFDDKKMTDPANSGRVLPSPQGQDLESIDLQALTRLKGWDEGQFLKHIEL
jgi:hypothetical protein